MSAREIIIQASRALSHRASASEAIQEIADTAGRLGRLDEVRITLNLAEEHTAIFRSFANAPAGAVMLRAITVNGAGVGTIEILARRPSMSAVELFKLFETLVTLLQTYAELQLRHIEHRQLRALRTLLDQRLEASKVEGRAIGILTALYGMTHAAARQWLEQKSLRESISLRTAAERVIERDAKAARRKAA